MRVFVTGATGFIGTAVVQDLIKAGHKVLGLAGRRRGEALAAGRGGRPMRGDVEDLDSLRKAQRLSDG